uniref:DNA repair protein XRCC4 n=1 Tax=Leptobrachium leishanense TaxID=445787 RepID=A0A8C5LN71_9ANUR
MEKNVQRICLTSNPGPAYFLQVDWKKDLGNGFNVTLCDGSSAWTGQVPEDDISKEASDMEMDRQKYVDELKKALVLNVPTTNKYNYDLVEDPVDCYSFTYEKKLRDLSFKLGSLRLTKSQNPAEIIREVIIYCLNSMAKLHSQNDHLQKENGRLQSDWKDMHEQLETFVNAKEELEQDLYTKFTHVLNEKKVKIRSLKEKLEHNDQKVEKTSSVKSSAFDTVPVNELKDEEYGGTTDEDSQNTEETTAPATTSRQRSIISTPDDSPDIAPSRKRRQRGQKSYYTEVKARKTETGEKQRCNPAPPKASANTSSSEAGPQASKSTPDPDDLFSDI